MVITFEPADARRDHAVLTELNVEYLDWLDANIQRDFGFGRASVAVGWEQPS